MKSWSRIDWLIIFLFAALVVLFYWRILTPDLADRQSFSPGDFSAQFWAFTTFELRELSAGRLPLWNPYTFAGAPFWADVQSAVFYPLSLLTLFLSGPWGFSLFALEIEAIAHFWLAAVFMYLFIRRITDSRPAAVIASLTFTFSGYLTGYPSQQLAILEADVWLPLILFFIYQARQRVVYLAQVNEPASDKLDTGPITRLSSPIPSLLLAGAAWGIAILAGHPQSALIIAYICLAYFLFLWLAPRRLLRLALYIVLFLATGLALAAIQFLPAVEYTLLSVRAEGTYDHMAGGLPVTDLIQLLLPGQVSFYSPLYVGIVGLILALWATFAAPARNRHTTFWAIVAFITLLISFGGNTFLYSLLYLYGPGFSIFRGQERWALATTFSLSVLAGYGFKALLHQVTGGKAASHSLPGETGQSAHPAKQVLSLTKYLFFFALLLTFIFFFGLNDTGWTADSPFFGLLGTATLVTLLAAFAWILWYFAPRLPTTIFTAFTAVLVCFDLFTANWQTNLYPTLPDQQTEMPAVVMAIKADAKTTPDEPYRVYNEFRLYDNYGVPFEIEDLWGASPLRPDRYDQFLAPPMPIERTWELLNVKYVITWREELYVPSTIIYQEPADDGTTYVHRLNEVGPRAWLVTQAEIIDDATILQKIADPNFDRWQTALLEPDAAPHLAELSLQKTQPQHEIHPTSLVWQAHSPDALSIQVETAFPALLILSEIHYPGWQVRIDGQPAPLLRADYVLRAIPVPAGFHTVELVFRPLTVTIGAIISALAVIVVATVLIWQKVKRKQYV